MTTAKKPASKASSRSQAASRPKVKTKVTSPKVQSPKVQPSKSVKNSVVKGKGSLVGNRKPARSALVTPPPKPTASKVATAKAATANGSKALKSSTVKASLPKLSRVTKVTKKAVLRKALSTKVLLEKRTSGTLAPAKAKASASGLKKNVTNKNFKSSAVSNNTLNNDVLSAASAKAVGSTSSLTNRAKKVTIAPDKHYHHEAPSSHNNGSVNSLTDLMNVDLAKEREKVTAKCVKPSSSPVTKPAIKRQHLHSSLDGASPLSSAPSAAKLREYEEGLVDAGSDPGFFPRDEVLDEAEQAQWMQLREQADIAVRARALNAPETHPDFDGANCIDCDEAIPPARLALHRIRCVDCQSHLEIDSRRHSLTYAVAPPRDRSSWD
jgi:RNA polymerase-binding transcription factor DksA